MKYSEVKIDFFDDENKCWCVDGYITDDDNEEGVVLAQIFILDDDDCVSAKVIETEYGAMDCSEVIDAIKQFIDELLNEDTIIANEEDTKLIKELYKMAVSQ